jgi:hypothetical protein
VIDSPPCQTSTTPSMTTIDVQASIQRRARVKHRMQPCGEGVGRGLTCRAFPTALYAAGWFCASCATRRGWALPNRGEDT